MACCFTLVKTHARFSHAILVVEKLCRSNRGCVFRAQPRLRTFYLQKEGIAVFVPEPEDLQKRIQQLRRNDARCQELLKKSYALSEQYFRIMESLSPEDRACMQEYQAVSEDLDDRTIQLIATHYALCGTKALRAVEL